MARNPFKEKRIAARRLIVYQGEDDDVAQVLEVRRIRSEDLQASGFAEILGPAALDSAREAAQRRQYHEHLLAGATEPEERARLQGELDEMIAARNREMVDAITADEGRTRALLGRCEAYLCAAVCGVGLAREDVEVAPGLHPRGTDPKALCRDLADPGQPPMYLRPGRYVKGPDAKDDEIPLSEVPVVERVALGLLVMAALEVASVVTTFPGQPGSARAG